MDSDELHKWFASMQEMLEKAYLATDEPWKQSGFAGPVERWDACRSPIADCVDSSGTFLDIGCANGYLLECLLRWTAERNIQIEPWGLDLSSKLVALARERLPVFAENIFIGNALTWVTPRTYDYVRTELCYVPDELQHDYVSRLLDEFLSPGGVLLVAEYRSRGDLSSGPWIDEVLSRDGYTVEFTTSGFWEGQELTRMAVVPGKPITPEAFET